MTRFDAYIYAGLLAVVTVVAIALFWVLVEEASLVGVLVLVTIVTVLIVVAETIYKRN